MGILLLHQLDAATGTASSAKTPATAAVLTNGQQWSSSTNFTTASISPTADKLVLVFTINTNSAGGTAAAPTGITGAGMTFTKVREVTTETSFSQFSVWCACDSSVSAGALTISHAVSKSTCQWTVIELTDTIAVAADNGIGALAQAFGFSTGGSDVNVNSACWLSEFLFAGHATVMATAADTKANTPTTTTASGFTELVDQHQATGLGWDIHQSSYFKNSADKTGTIVASQAAASNFKGIISLEVTTPDASGDQDITGVKYTNTSTFGTNVVTRGAVGITGVKYTNPDTFGTNVVTRGTVNVGAVKHVNNNTFGTGVVTRGPVAITGVKYGNINTFGTTVVGRGAVTVSGTKYVDSDTFGTAVVKQISNIIGVKFTNTNTFGSARVNYGVSGSKFTNVSTFGSATLQSNQNIVSVKYNNVNIFRVAVVAGGSWPINAVKYNNTNSFGLANVSTGAVVIFGTRFIDPDTFYTSTVEDPLTGGSGGNEPNVYFLNKVRGRRG